MQYYISYFGATMSTNEFIPVTDPRIYCYITYPKLTPLITSGTFEKGNMMAASWVTYLSFRPPLFGVSIAPGRYTHELIEKYECFGICFLPFELVKKVWDAGNVSGRDVDKFKMLGLTKMKAAKITAPLIKESIACLECKLYAKHPVGDHTFFVGEIVHAWVRRGMLKGKILNLEKAKQVYYAGDGYFITLDPKTLKRLY